MSNQHLRTDKECANCGYMVDVAYCSKCGQKNTETRQSFHHLFTHFVEDLTHYDGAFWKTIKYLLFRPGKLTKTYLEGHRQAFVPPVKLYIFISFVTFFLMTVLPNDIVKEDNKEVHAKEVLDKKEKSGAADIQHIQIGNHHFSSIKQLEQAIEKEPGELNFMERLIGRLIIKTNTGKLDIYDLVDSFIHILPKVLFIYMPIFCFWLWLVHGKRRWYFFDHGIFTLHFFSFVLLITTITQVAGSLANLTGSSYIIFIVGVINVTILLGYSTFYFFRAHSNMYGEKKWISRLKGLFLYIINLILVSLAFAFTVMYVLYTAH